MLPLRDAWFTHDEFLERERESKFRHEYKQGRIEMMAGGSRDHSLIGANCVQLLGVALRGRNCETHATELLVHIAPMNMSVYPDAMVICGNPNYLDRRRLVVTNPILAIEVASPSTANYDRNEKFPAYRQLPSLQEFVLISQTEPRVEVFRRSSGWVSTEYVGLDAIVRLESLAVDLPVSEIDARVDWSPA